MRLPNGFGNVSKLGGKRRNPWRARRTDRWEIDETTGKAKQIFETIGYFPTRQAAIQALSEYNANPYDISLRNLTFAEVYERWSEKKFEKIGASNVNGYKASYKICEPLYGVKFSDIKLPMLQRIVDKSGKNPPTLKKLKILLNQMFDYAVKNNIILKENHLVKYLDVGQQEQSTLHYRFTDEEVEKLWMWSNGNEYVQLILMLIYSGVRPGEMFNLRSELVDLDAGFFTIEKGKTVNAARKVPIHHKTRPFFEHWLSKGTKYFITNRSGGNFDFFRNHASYTDVYWTPILRDIGILSYKNEKGEIADHLPDDTRHTFTTMWKEKRLDESMRRRIQGHSGKGIGEIVYTHYDLEKLAEELNKL